MRAMISFAALSIFLMVGCSSGPTAESSSDAMTTSASTSSELSDSLAGKDPADEKTQVCSCKGKQVTCPKDAVCVCDESGPSCG